MTCKAPLRLLDFPLYIAAMGHGAEMHRTCAACFSSAPASGTARGSGVHAARLRSSSAALIKQSSRRATQSMRTRSPSRMKPGVVLDDQLTVACGEGAVRTAIADAGDR